jgi:hypothetical protein
MAPDRIRGMVGQNVTPENQLLALIAARDAQDSFSRAIGWTVAVTHADDLAGDLTLYGTFSEPAAALAWAADFEAGLNTEGEEGFRCLVLPLMPAIT